LRACCTKWLKRATVASEAEQRASIRGFMRHLIVLTLVSIPTPRAQIFSLMKVDENLRWRNELKSYELTFNGYDPPLKNEKAIYLVLPQVVGKFYRSWLQTFRPFYTREECPFVFANTKGTGRIRKITPLVTPITLEYLEKRVLCSKFRYSL
jgi:hypothetical protein